MLVRRGFGRSRFLRRGLTRSLSTAAEYLESLVKVNYETSVDRSGLRDNEGPLDSVNLLLEALGRPQEALSVVHVVGSKGKGGTSSILSGILSRSGLRVGTYTSPHVVSLGERVLIDGEDCEDGRLLEHFRDHEAEVLKVQGQTGWRLSHFEALTALSLKYFADRQVDLAVVEAGLGGVKDATNVFSNARGLRLVVVTPLELEHTDVLGERLEDIVAAKVGVVKRGTPLVVANQSSKALENLVAEEANSLGCGRVMRTSVECQVAYHHRDDDSGRRDYSFAVRGSPSSRRELRQARLPKFVVDNASTALVAAEFLASGFGIDIRDEDVEGALRDHQLPGRFQILPGRGGGAIVLDGAHTPKSAKVLVDTLIDLYPGREFVFVIAMAKDKDVGSFLAEVARANPKKVVCTSADEHSRSCHQDEILKSAQALGLPAVAAADFQEARALAKAKEGDNALLVYTGSFRTVATFLKQSPVRQQNA
ncbi:folylpolyglutamate synthetase [Chloropicon primus]|uniref:Folylpolyglutamate synthetase n=1 Tax=Chloropicon primus TaxID=1764295 RepID=A0A5B8MLN2_9CHLO|nr:folylpolyglutamate synthetase [Chloropicon primus]|eukprot:QDZ20555.1 folylpolyglutamate synthetase [Chloropicon primus]